MPRRRDDDDEEDELIKAGDASDGSDASDDEAPAPAALVWSPPKAARGS